MLEHIIAKAISFRHGLHGYYGSFQSGFRVLGIHFPTPPEGTGLTSNSRVISVFLFAEPVPKDLKSSLPTGRQVAGENLLEAGLIHAPSDELI